MYRQVYTPTNRHIQTHTDPHTLSNVFFDQLFLHESLNTFSLEEEGVKEGKKVTKSHVYVTVVINLRYHLHIHVLVITLLAFSLQHFKIDNLHVMKEENSCR